MLKPKAFANAITIVFVVAYVICGLISFIAPDLLFSIAGSWFHGMNLEAIKATTPMGLGTFIFGVVTFAGYVWFLTFSGASLYNKFAK